MCVTAMNPIYHYYFYLMMMMSISLSLCSIFTNLFLCDPHTDIGIGDPLKAVYARTYLVLCGSSILGNMKNRDDIRRTMVESNLQDSFISLTVLRDDAHMSFTKASIKLGSYIHLLSPAIEWMVYNVGLDATREQFQAVLQLYREYSNEAMVLRHIIDAFDPIYYSHGSIGMAALIKVSEPSLVSIVDVFTSLGRKLLLSPPPEGATIIIIIVIIIIISINIIIIIIIIITISTIIIMIIMHSSSPPSSPLPLPYLDQRIPLLNEVWKVVCKGRGDITSFINCCSAWLELTLAYYSDREIFVILASLASRLKEEEEAEEEAQQSTTLHHLHQHHHDWSLPDIALSSLEGILSILLAPSSKVSSAVLGSAYLLQLIDNFKGTKKVLICKVYMEYLQNNPCNSEVEIVI